MNPVYIDGDLRKSHLYHDGDVIVTGALDVAGDVAISGNLFVFNDISIGGDCGVEEIICYGDVNIAGFLNCNGLYGTSNIKVGYIL